MRFLASDQRMGLGESGFWNKKTMES
jgi:hypothetical protein